jgi:hypothetical protein
MSRRYAPQFWRNVFYAVISPFLFLFGQRKKVEQFFTMKIHANRDQAEAVSSTVLGLSFLFWAFFFQLIAVFLEMFH